MAAAVPSIPTMLKSSYYGQATGFLLVRLQLLRKFCFSSKGPADITFHFPGQNWDRGYPCLPWELGEGKGADSRQWLLGRQITVSSTPGGVPETEEAFTLLERLFSRATKTFTGGATNSSCLGQKSIQA